MSWHTSPLAAPGAGTAGGMNVYVRGVADALGRAGLGVDIITSARHASATVVTPLGERVRVVTVPRSTRLERLGKRLPRYEVVHSHYWQSAAPARALAELSGSRHVHTFHTLGHVKNEALAPGDVPEPDNRLCAEREILRDVDAVVVATDSEKAQLREHAPSGLPPIHVTPPGVDTRLFRRRDGRAAVRARLGLRDRLVVVHAGRIQPLKGIGLAVRALRHPDLQLPRDCTLVVAGGPSGRHGHAALRELQRETRRLPAGVDVRLVGRWPHRWLPALLGAADAAVVCSHSESFCLAALEAQACGVPVVGTRVGGLSGLIADGDSGFLVERDAGAFAERLSVVLESPRARARMSAAAVEVARPYSWTATASAIRDVYCV